VVVVTGPFEGADVQRWAALITEAMAIRPQRLVVDLAGTTRLDAAAIVVLLEAHRAMVHSGGSLMLRKPVAAVLRVLQLARVDRVFEVANPNRAEVMQVEPVTSGHS
jgi:anti-anti-sigma factor